MAVRANNVNNARKARMWSEQDDANLVILLRRKIKDTTVAIRESETPYERSRLKAQRARYKEMLRKVETGNYNGDIIFNELRAAAALRQESEFASGLHTSMAGGKAYTNSYGNVDFDYEAAFRKKRYYGASLPIILTLLSIILLASMLLGILSPHYINRTITNKITDGTQGMININTMFVYKIDSVVPGTNSLTINGVTLLQGDIKVQADENGKWWWPEANYPSEYVIEQGKPYATIDSEGKVKESGAESVLLKRDLGVTAIYIDAADVIKAWFHTKMLEKTRIDVLENLSVFQGTSAFYSIFLADGKASQLVIKKENGQYNRETIINHLGVYGAILYNIVAIVFMVIILIQNIVRIFTYTSRRLHFTTFLCLLFSALGWISPALATCEGTELGVAFKNYFLNLTNAEAFMSEATASVGVTIMGIIPVAICFVMLILPKFFRNRHKDLPARVPKGNRKAHV